MHVLHLLPDLSIGGGQTIVHQHVRHHDRSRFRVTIATIGRDLAMRSALEAAGASVVAVHPDRCGRLGALRELVGLVRADHVEVIHVHTDLERPLGHAAGFLTGTPVVGHLHGEWNHFGPHTPAGAHVTTRARKAITALLRDRLEHRAVRHYIAESRAVQRLVGPALRHPVTVLDQSVPVDEIDAALERNARRAVRDQLGIPRDAPVIITVARMVDGKGHDELLVAFGRVLLARPETILVLVGDGPTRPEVEAAIADAGMGSAVRLLGDRFDVPALLAAADLFAFASHTEGFGLVVLEAMAARLPVVAYDLPAFSEFAIDGETAVLAPIGDTGALARGICEFLDDPPSARAAGEAGRAVVDHRYPVDATARTFEAVYDTICPNGD